MRATQLLREEHEIILRGLAVLEASAAKGSPPPPELIEFFSGFADAHHHQAIAREDQRCVDEAFEAFEQGAAAERTRHEATLLRLARELP
jgi:hemerythrin-like domain-containing protein